MAAVRRGSGRGAGDSRSPSGPKMPRQPSICPRSRLSCLPPSHPSISARNRWGYTGVTTATIPSGTSCSGLTREMFVSCSLCSAWVLGGGLSPVWRQGTWGAMPWARPSCFYILWADGNDRATPHSKSGCLWWLEAGGGPTVCPERCHSSSVPPAQLCQVSLQASANLLGSQGDQAHFA